ncbi:hypothetical protein ABT369_25420 [Dactylosporangium sp. NPDC000244]|uniref:hypothetical protein n=1 Tax=Dactylosporangium sp. NPDC000244 TaxID=3154365 RepID=UPI0033225B39
MERRYAEYQPVTPWRRFRRHVKLFRSVQLNVVGWSAVAVLCLAGAGVGYSGARLVGLPVGPCLAGGAAAVLAGLLILDRRRWARHRDHGASER